MNKKQRAYQKGVWAESLASLFLLSRGYKTLATRYKVKGGEIDLIICKRRTLAFVEVKARQDIADALEAVTPRSRKRIETAALCYIAENPDYADYDLRFDVVGVVGAFHIQHIDNAWRPET